MPISKIERAGMPGGAVLQVIQDTANTEVTNSATAIWVEIGLSVTITPSSATSKIMVSASIPGPCKAIGDTEQQFRILRNATEITWFPCHNSGNTTPQYSSSAVFEYLDNPATTSSITYLIQMRNRDAGGTVRVMSNGGVGTLTVMEIAA